MHPPMELARAHIVRVAFHSILILPKSQLSSHQCNSKAAIHFASKLCPALPLLSGRMLFDDVSSHDAVVEEEKMHQ